MSILSGYGKFKRYILTDEGYKLCSQWTNSNTVEFDDGNTAQTKLGAINGITDSLTATSSNIALSSKAGNSLQSQINELNTGMVAETTTPDSSIALTPIAGEPYDGGCWYFVRGSKVHVHLSLHNIPTENGSIHIVQIANYPPKVGAFVPVCFGTLQSVGMLVIMKDGYVQGGTPDGYIIGDFEYQWK